MRQKMANKGELLDFGHGEEDAERVLVADADQVSNVLVALGRGTFNGGRDANQADEKKSDF